MYFLSQLSSRWWGAGPTFFLTAYHTCLNNSNFSWDIFKYADTPQWERYFEFAKPIIGIKQWGDNPIDRGPELKSAFTVSKEDIIYNIDMTRFAGQAVKIVFLVEKEMAVWTMIGIIGSIH